MTDQLPPPPAPQPASAPAPSQGPKRRGRPAFGAVIEFAIALRVGREVVEEVAFARYGFLGIVVVFATVIALLVGWRADQRRQARKRWGVEFTPEVVARQLADSGVGPPAFAEDGTLLGASLLVVNQRPKVLEVNTDYEVFGSAAQRTSFDGQDRYIGTIRQENVLWKIRFQLLDAAGNVVGGMRAENVRAWDFQIHNAYGREVATVIKSWEGWARTAFTRADRYVVRIHEPLPYPLRHLALATALTADVALKQDARGIS